MRIPNFSLRGLSRPAPSQESNGRRAGVTKSSFQSGNPCGSTERDQGATGVSREVSRGRQSSTTVDASPRAALRQVLRTRVHTDAHAPTRMSSGAVTVHPSAAHEKPLALNDGRGRGQPWEDERPQLRMSRTGA